MNNETYDYSIHSDKLKNFCCICGERIPQEDFEHEDYYVVFRGYSRNAYRGCICFDCMPQKVIKHE
jgi:hypothetical protein